MEVGANPVQVEVGDFDEAIDVVEDVVESKFTNKQLPPMKVKPLT